MKSIPVLLSLLALHPTSGEHRRFDGPINAASNYVHYSEGYIVTPGYVDVSNLVFSSSADNGSNSNKLFSGKARDGDWNDEEMGEVAVDDDAEYDDDADYEGDDDGGRRLDGEDEGGESGSTVSFGGLYFMLFCAVLLLFSFMVENLLISFSHLISVSFFIHKVC